MKAAVYFLLTFFILGIKLPSAAQKIEGEYVVKKYDLHNGLATPLNTGSYRDQLGRIWLSTAKGLACFDGTVFRNYGGMDGLPEEPVTMISGDKKGRVYALTNNGIFLYEPAGRYAFRKLYQCPAQSKIYYLFPVDTNDIYFGIKQGTFWDLIHLQNGRSRKIFTQFALKGVAVDAGIIYAADNNAIYIIRNNKAKKYPLAPGNATYMTGFVPDLEGFYWFKTYKLFKIAPDKGIIDSLPVPRNEANFYQVTFTGQRQYIAAGVSNEQIYRFDGTNLITLNMGSKDILDRNQTTSTGIYPEPDGTIWLSNLFGLFQIRPLSYHTLPIAPNYLDYIYTIGPQYEKLFVYDPGFPGRAHVLNTLYKSRELGNVQRIYVEDYKTEKEKIWYCRYFGFAVEEGQKLQVQKLGDDLYRNIQGLLKDGEQSWLFGLSKLILYKNGLFIDKSSATKMPMHFDGVADREHTVWLPASDGLYIYDSQYHKVETGLPADQSFTACAKDKNGYAWLCGSKHHIYKVQSNHKGGMLLIDSIASPFPGEQVKASSIVFDKYGDLWAIYPNGIVIFFRSNGNQRSYLYITPDEGIVPLLPQGENAISATADGNICLTDFPATVLHVDEIRRHYNRQPPLPYITGIYLFNKEYNWGANGYRLDSNRLPLSLRLPHDQNALTFYFSSIGFRNSPYYHYQYRLKGLEAKWQEADETRKAVYTNLAPGTYTIMLRAANENGIWSSPFSYTFTITPPWYFSWWGWWILISFGLGIIVLIFHLRQRVLKRRYRTEQLITEQQLIALRAQINPHFIQNTFSFLAENVLQGTREITVSLIDKVSVYLRNILYISNQTVVSLEKEIDFIEEYLSVQQMIFDHRISYEINIDDDVDTFTLKIPSMLLQPLVENAIKYGTRGNGNCIICIGVTQNEHYVICSISDNGPQTETRDLEIKPGTLSKGLQMTEDKLRMMFGKHKHKPQITLAPNPAGPGHVAKVFIPVA